MTNHPWIFEPCSPEDERDTYGNPWPHAVRGLKPGGRRVVGYGYTEPHARHDAERKAAQYDARETIGERGEIINPYTVLRTSPLADTWAHIRDDLRRAGLLR